MYEYYLVSKKEFDFWKDKYDEFCANTNAKGIYIDLYTLKDIYCEGLLAEDFKVVRVRHDMVTYIFDVRCTLFSKEDFEG